MKKLILSLISFVCLSVTAQTKYYCAKNLEGKSKDLMLSFSNGIGIEELGGVPVTGSAMYNTGKKQTIPIFLEKVETAIDNSGKTGQRYYYFEGSERPSSPRYIITEWPSVTEIIYVSKSRVKFYFYCQGDYNFDHTILCDWAK